MPEMRTQQPSRALGMSSDFLLNFFNPSLSAFVKSE
jgi:hypothetical protein